MMLLVTSMLTPQRNSLSTHGRLVCKRMQVNLRLIFNVALLIGGTVLKLAFRTLFLVEIWMLPVLICCRLSSIAFGIASSTAQSPLGTGPLALVFCSVRRCLVLRHLGCFHLLSAAWALGWVTQYGSPPLPGEGAITWASCRLPPRGAAAKSSECPGRYALPVRTAGRGDGQPLGYHPPACPRRAGRA